MHGEIEGVNHLINMQRVARKKKGRQTWRFTMTT